MNRRFGFVVAAGCLLSGLLWFFGLLLTAPSADSLDVMVALLPALAIFGVGAKVFVTSLYMPDSKSGDPVRPCHSEPA
jgi:hypothetical protein